MPKRQLDAYDRRILEALQQNGRLTNVELAEQIGLSPSPCLRRVRLMEEAGVIQGLSLIHITLSSAAARLRLPRRATASKARSAASGGMWVGKVGIGLSLSQPMIE